MSFSWVKVFVSVVLVVWYYAMPRYVFFDVDRIVMEGTEQFLGHFLYSFCHANVWHLFANIVCLWMIPCELHLLGSFFVALVCSFLPCFVCEGTCGFSGVLFAIVGMSWGRVGRFVDMLCRNKWFLVVPLFLPHVNGLLHVYCLVMGWLVGRLWRDSITPQWKKDWV